jgi:hypothetical protein
VICTGAHIQNVGHLDAIEGVHPGEAIVSGESTEFIICIDPVGISPWMRQALHLFINNLNRHASAKGESCRPRSR